MPKSRLVKDFGVLIAVCAAYVLAGRFGFSFAFVNPSVTPVSPAPGIALAALILIGYRVWPAILLGSFVLYASTLGAGMTAATISLSTTVEVLLGAYAITAFAGGRKALDTTQSILRFAALAALVSTTISATAGATSLALTGRANWADYGTVWITWWIGNLGAALLVAPFLMLWSAQLTIEFRSRKIWEAAALFVLLVFVGVSVFGGLLPPKVETYPVEFLCVPVLLWAALRFGRREVATAGMMLSAIAIWGTLHQHGPFVRSSPNESLLVLQGFMSVIAIMTVALAALIAQYARAEQQLRELAVTDPLTGLPNYRKLLEVLRAEISKADRSDSPLAVLFFDMDGLKQINDEYGHLAGSRAVSRMAEAIRKACRTTDTPARFGGDEFVVVLPDTDEAGAQRVARRVMERLAADPDKPTLSASAGVAVYPRDGATPAMLLSSADRALYKMKVKRPSRRTPVVAVAGDVKMQEVSTTAH